MSRFLRAALVALSVVAAGCSGRSAEPSAQDTPPSAADGVQPVRLASADGAALPGRLYGRGSRNGVALIADAGRGVDGWDALARGLAAAGYLVLALELPGAHAGGPATVGAAADYLRTRGAARVSVVGEGEAGAIALASAAAERVSGVAAISAPAAGQGAPGDIGAAATRIDGPVLLVGSLGDRERAAAARRLYDAAHEPRTLALVPGAARGSDILHGAEAAQVRAVLYDFLREAFAERSAATLPATGRRPRAVRPCCAALAPPGSTAVLRTLT